MARRPGLAPAPTCRYYVRPVQAPIEIRYEGAVLARAASATGSLEDGGTLFVPLADPMPVGTRLELHAGADVALVRVVKVVESADPQVAGINVRPAGVADHFEHVETVPEPVAPAASAPVAAAPAPTKKQGTGKTGTHQISGELPATARAAAPAPSNGVNPGETGEVATLEGDDTSSTSEYPALSNGAGGKRKRKTKKA